MSGRGDNGINGAFRELVAHRDLVGLSVEHEHFALSVLDVIPVPGEDQVYNVGWVFLG